MSIKFTRRLIEVFIGLFVIGGIIKLVRALAAATSGDFGTVSWPISSDSPASTDLVSGGAFSWTHGNLAVTDMPFARLFELATELAALGLLIVSMLALRRLLLSLASGDVFTDDNIAALRRIGFSLIGICALSISVVLLLQPAILSNTVMPDGFLLHPSISWNEKGVTNIWLEYEVPVFTFLLGALAILTGEAFKSGKAYREDSESVV